MFPEGHEENEDPNAGQQITTKVTKCVIRKNISWPGVTNPLPDNWCIGHKKQAGTQMPAQIVWTV